MDSSLKNKITTIIVISFLIKIIGLVYRFLLARILGIESMKVFSLLAPTLSLSICLSSLSIPIVINQRVSKNISKEKYTNRSTIKSAFRITLISSSLIAIVILTCGSFIANNVIKNSDIYYPLFFTIPIIYFSNFSGILKGYLDGHKKFSITSRCNLYEQIVKLIITLSFIYFLRHHGIVIIVCGAITGIAISELFSLIFLTFKVSRLTKLTFKETKTDKVKDIMSQATPLTINHLIFSIVSFLEPILFTYIMQKNSYSVSDTQSYYTLVNAYSFPVLTMAFFASHSISKAIFPYISSQETSKKSINSLITKSLILCFGVGIINFNISYFYTEEFLMILFGNKASVDIIHKLSFFYIIYYLYPILVSALQALGLEKKLLINNLIGHFFELVGIVTLCQIKSINFDGFIYSIGVCFIISIILHYLTLRKHQNYKISFTLLISIGSLFAINFILNKLFLSFMPFYLSFILVGLVNLIILYIIYMTLPMNKSLPSEEA